MPIVQTHGDVGALLEAAEAAGTADRNRFLLEARRHETDRAFAFADARLARQDEATQLALDRAHQARMLRMDSNARLRELSHREASATARQAALAKERRLMAEEREEQAAQDEQSKQARDAQSRDEQIQLWATRFKTAEERQSPAALDALSKIKLGKAPDLDPRMDRDNREDGLLELDIGSSRAADQAEMALRTGDIEGMAGVLRRPGEERFEGGAVVRDPDTLTDQARAMRAGIIEAFRNPGMTAEVANTIQQGIDRLPTADGAVLREVFDEQFERWQRTQAEVVAPTVVENLPAMIDDHWARFQLEATAQGVNLAELTEPERMAFEGMFIEHLVQQTGLTFDQIEDVITAMEGRQRKQLEDLKQQLRMNLDAPPEEPAAPPMPGVWGESSTLTPHTVEA